MSSSQPSADIALYNEPPTTDEYLNLRAASGLSPFSRQAAERGLAGSVHAVTLRAGQELVGMGRLIGDGGCFFQVVDIAVRPDHQGQGLGTRIMRALMDWVEAELPTSAYISLIADGEANRLYARFGFAATAPASIGMAFRKP